MYIQFWVEQKKISGLKEKNEIIWVAGQNFWSSSAAEVTMAQVADLKSSDSGIQLLAFDAFVGAYHMSFG